MVGEEVSYKGIGGDRERYACTVREVGAGENEAILVVGEEISNKTKRRP